MEWLNENYTISTDKTKLDISYVHEFLIQSYWAKNIPLETVKKSIDGSLCFAMYHNDKQVGFARVITDNATFAYLADVFIGQEYRGKGLGKWLVKIIINYPSLQDLRRFMLATRDAHSLYKQFGFEQLTNTDRWMQIHKAEVYTARK
ncbi:MAG TPA: GNAT family N-acetyltransferase [Flavisolibacter sp.]|jgi:N-acetylglutamate synthase-like GNAT family acetyltransferase|nr:GNAT family N-acetyltransferase [Flavisolibacter sp.]